MTYITPAHPGYLIAVGVIIAVTIVAAFVFALMDERAKKEKK